MKVAYMSDKKQKWSFLLLETLKDVVTYRAIDEQIKAKQSINLYFGFKSQTFKTDIGDYAVHEAESDNKMAHVMALAVQLQQKEKLSLVDYCQLSDKIINDIHRTMLKMVSEGKTVRVNKHGGYCTVLPEDTFDSIIEINEIELYNYLIHREIEVDFKINSHTIVIENDSFVPQSVIKKYLEFTGDNPDELQIITSFKHKTLLFTQKDWFNFFRLGKEQGLKNIVFQSTSQDMRQIYGMRDILQTLATGNTQFNIFVDSWRLEKLLPTLNYDKSKLNITILK